MVRRSNCLQERGKLENVIEFGLEGYLYYRVILMLFSKDMKDSDGSSSFYDFAEKVDMKR